jgi:dimethylhistidine N-methyltransferase
MEQIVRISEFAKDTLEGLTSEKKFLSSKYFYDEKGSRIFQDIMRMPEYYLTDCELEIMETHKQDIFKEFIGIEKQLKLLELGAGDGLKTKILLNHFIGNNANFEYSPIDISGESIRNLVSDLENEIPKLKVNGLIGDYFKLIDNFKNRSHLKKVILFLGSNIGNFNKQTSLVFFKSLADVMNPKDQVFVGFDLKKETSVIMDAYNDPHGHTASFNLNLLNRINNELNADFVIENFMHHETYDPNTGTAKSYLISKCDQKVSIAEIEKTIKFVKYERIFTEISQKYDMEMIEELADATGFEIVRNFYDERQYFVNSLLKLKSK